MKWYFALSEETLTDRNYLDLVRVALFTALNNTTLRPVLLYDGKPNPTIEVFARAGAAIVPCRSRFADLIERRWPDQPHLQRIARGAFLRLEIPILETEDDFILYTDCDVQFLREPRLSSYQPEYFAAAPEVHIGDYEQLNSGVLVLHVSGMRSQETAFTAFIRAHFNTFDVFDQSALAIFFRGKFDFLPPTLNWKPYWEFGLSTEIMHFHLKPFQIRPLAAGDPNPGFDPLRHLFALNPNHAVHAANAWYEALAAARVALPVPGDPLDSGPRPDIWPSDFDGARYLIHHRDVARSGMDPFSHYVAHGKQEGRQLFTAVGG